MATKESKANWYIYKLNDDHDWVKIKKTCETLDEAKAYALKQKAECTMISNKDTLYRRDNNG